MKLKRLISLLLLAIYLTAWGGPAYVSLSCKCVTMSSHVCCHHCQHGTDAAGAGESLKAPCCGNHHSTEIELYTGSSSSSSGRRFPNAAILSSCGAMCAPQGFVPLPHWLKTFLGRMLRASARK